MAVQAQYPANVFRGSVRNINNINGEYYFHQQQFQNNNQCGGGGGGGEVDLITNTGNVLIGGLTNINTTNYDWRNINNKARQDQMLIMNGAAVLSDHESELTCNVSASRKRNRGVDQDITTTTTIDHHHHHQQQQQQQMPYQHHHLDLQNHHNQQQQQASQSLIRYGNKLQKCQGGLMNNNNNNNNSTTTNTTGISASYEESRLHESGVTSTSGRSSSTVVCHPCLISPLASSSATPLHHHQNSHLLLHHNHEVDALILLHNEKLRSVLEETRKRQCRTLLSAVEQQVVKRLEEKDAELQNANHKNAELEDKIKQISAENQIWFNVAKNNEAIVTSLKSTLEQILLQNNNNNNNNVKSSVDQITREEGYGDSEGPLLVLNGLAGGGGADHHKNHNNNDAQSCCYQPVVVLEEEAAEDRTGVLGGGGGGDHEHQQQQVMQQRKLCRVCDENEVSVLLLPCRHLCLCKDCESKLDFCPICNSMKNASLQIFMS